MGFIEIILFSICIAYFDKLLLLILYSFGGAFFSSSSLSSSSVDSVDSLIRDTKTTFDRPDGTRVYQDANGKTIGLSSYDKKTGETTYWNENMEYVGKSEKGCNGNEKYFDSKLNYKGQSEKNSNGSVSYYDEKLNFKGTSRENSNGTSSYFKK